SLKSLSASMTEELRQLRAERDAERKEREEVAKSAADELSALDARYKAECDGLRKDLTAAVESAAVSAKSVDALKPVVKSLEDANGALRKELDAARAKAGELEKALSDKEVVAAQAQESL